MTTTYGSRWIVIDDADSKIQYDSGTWFAVSNSFSNVGNFGSTYLSSLHGTNGTAGLSFRFRGSAVDLMGTNNLRNSSGVLDPTWGCSIDGKSFAGTEPFRYPENNWAFCQWKGDDGDHTLTLNVTSQGQTFWVDQIQYLPSPTLKIEKSMVLVKHFDGAIKYDSVWQRLGDFTTQTRRQGGSATFEFFGTKLSWWGYIPTEDRQTSTTATYSIDGQAPVTFALKAIPNTSATLYNQMFFETPTLSADTQHRLFVIYQGNGDTAPFTLNQLLIENGEHSSFANTSSNSNNTDIDPPPTTLPSSDDGTPIGAIVGGVVGGLCFILILAALFYFWRRRRNRPKGSTSNVRLDTGIHEPFSAPQNPLISYYTPQPVSMGSTPYGSTSDGIATSHQHWYQQPAPASNTVAGARPTHVPRGSESTSASAPGPFFKSPSHGVQRGPVAVPNTTTHPPYVSSESESTSASDHDPFVKGPSHVVAPSIVVYHEDSGVRLPSRQPAEDGVMEVPPTYTPA